MMGARVSSAQMRSSPGVAASAAPLTANIKSKHQHGTETLLFTTVPPLRQLPSSSQSLVDKGQSRSVVGCRVRITSFQTERCSESSTVDSTTQCFAHPDGPRTLGDAVIAPPHRRRRLPHDELRRQKYARFPVLAVQRVAQHAGRRCTHVKNRNRHARQRRRHVRANRRIVEADDGHVVRHPQAHIPRRRQAPSATLSSMATSAVGRRAELDVEASCGSTR